MNEPPNSAPMTQDPDSSRWYYYQDNQAVGPLPLSSIKALQRAGQLVCDSLLAREGSEHWQPLTDVLGPLPAPASPPALQAPQGGKGADAKRQRAMLFLLIGLVCVLLTMLPGMLGRGPNPESPRKTVSPKVQSKPLPQEQFTPTPSTSASPTPITPTVSGPLFVVLKGSTMYADKETLSIMERESEKGGDAGTRALVSLGDAGKIWTEEYSIMVSVIESGGPLDSSLVEASNGGKGLKASRFWVGKTCLLPQTNHAAKLVSDESKTVSKASFRYVVDGRSAVDIGRTDAEHLIHLIDGIYGGAISDAQAKQCLVRREAVGGSNPCEFQYLVDDYLIYEGVLSVRAHYQFALVRDRSFEDGYKSPSEFYKMLKGGGFFSGDPLYWDGLVFVGRATFTTAQGVVVSVPVFKSVNVQP